jgi:hypothetical protein
MKFNHSNTQEKKTFTITTVPMPIHCSSKSENTPTQNQKTIIITISTINQKSTRIKLIKLHTTYTKQRKVSLPQSEWQFREVISIKVGRTV